MSYVYTILLAIFSVYSVSMMVLIIGWLLATNEKKTNGNKKQTNKISVLIPFRNEEKNVEKLINSLSQIDYPKNAVEFIFINDHSTDKGEKHLIEILTNFSFSSQLISLSQEQKGKKAALKLGVSISQYPNIVTTDADCTFSKNWLLSMNHLISYKFIIGPVINEKKSGVLANIQQIEALMLAGVTVGSAYLKKPLLCSGANLSYSKFLFEELKPYDDNFRILSGDDMFFLEKVVRNDAEIGVNIDSIVETKGAESFQEMLSRSIRWASKSSKLNLIWTSFFSAIVLITNYSVLFVGVMLFFAGDSIVFFIKLCGIKAIIDVLFLILLANWYNRYEAILYFPVMIVYYPIYVFIVSIASILISPKWEGRRL